MENIYIKLVRKDHKEWFLKNKWSRHLYMIENKMIGTDKNINDDEI